MRVIAHVAVSVFKESVRDKVLYNLVVFAVLLMSASYLMATGFLVVALVLAASLLGRRRTPVPQVAEREQLDLAA